MQGDQVAHPDGLFSGDQLYGRLAALDRAGAHIDMTQPAIIFLGWLAVLPTRTHLGQKGLSRYISRLVKRLPMFSAFIT